MSHKKTDPTSVVRHSEMKSIASPALSKAAYRAHKKLDPKSVVREGEFMVGRALGKAAGKKGRKGRRHLKKLTSKQRAEYMVRTRGRKSKKMGR
jgi:hypothetical protein